MKDILDIHSHTIASGHAYNTLYEMARAAADNGMELFGSSDHGPALPGSSHEMYFCNFKSIPKELFGMRLIMGCELNILDYKGTLDLKEWLLKRVDYGIASIHDLCYKTGSREENTAAAVNAMKSPYVQVIGHPDNANIPLDYAGCRNRRNGKRIPDQRTQPHSDLCRCCPGRCSGFTGPRRLDCHKNAHRGTA